MGIALGITAAVVIAPMAQASSPATKLTAGSPAIAHQVGPVTAPLVDVQVAVEVPTIIKNEPPPAAKPKAKPSSSGKSKQEKFGSAVSADGDKNCGDKDHRGWGGWKDKD